MAVGVPENDVYQAADAVLARGERPTVERVRIELGRGSPARVGQLLEQWWEQLAQRLKGHALLPELPGEVAQAFIEAWRIALVHAEASARTTLAEDQNALFAAQTTLTQERKLWEIALTEAQAQVAESTSKLAQAELQLRERQALVDQMDAQRNDLQQQRDRLQTQVEQQRSELEMLRTERNAAHEHARAVEDRAHQQVDQARQEIKALQQQRERAQRDHTKAITQLTAQEQELRSSLRIAEQAAAHQAGRVAALQATVAHWRNSSGDAKRAPTKRGAAAPTKSKRQSRKVSQ